LKPGITFGQSHDLGLAQGGNEAEVKGVEGLAGRQARFCKMSLDASLLPFSEFQFGKGRQQARSRPALLVCP
jgi:hypothetical protein